MKIIFLLFFVGSFAQDLSIYGKFNTYLSAIDQKEKNSIAGKCFGGIGFLTCTPNLATDDITLSYNLPYYNILSSFYGSAFCLECCGTTADYIDIWDLSCKVEATTTIAYNYFGYELRLAKNRFAGDTDYVKCPLPRSTCTYDSEGNTLSCDQSTHYTYLTGIDITIHIEEYSSNFKYWRGAKSCEIKAYESNTTMVAGDYFSQKITLVHPPVMQPIDYGQGIILALFGIFVLMFFVCLCRRQKCIVCQSRLICCYRRCFMCRFVGAEPPDPVLLAILEERGEKIQGIPPEQFPGSRLLVKFIRGIGEFLTNAWETGQCWNWSCWKCSCCKLSKIMTKYSKINSGNGVEAGNDTLDPHNQAIEKQEGKDIDIEMKPIETDNGKASKRKNKKPKHINPNLLPYSAEFMTEAIYAQSKLLEPPSKGIKDRRPKNYDVMEIK